MEREEEGQMEDDHEVEISVAARQALAGALAGVTSSLILHPLDTAKTYRQSNPSMYVGVLPTLRSVASSRGVTALYSGIIPALFGSAPSSAVYFSTYEFSRRRLNRLKKGRLGLPLPRMAVNMLAAASGNVMSSAIFVPKEVLKQRLQVGMGRSVFEVGTGKPKIKLDLQRKPAV